MRRIVFDADELYQALKQGSPAFVDKLAAYRASGFEILLRMPAILPSADKNLGLDQMFKRLQELTSLCDTIVFGGPDGQSCALHLDDKAVSQEEFVVLRHEELRSLVEGS